MDRVSENPAVQAAAEDYLDRLRRAGADLPDGAREELLDNIAHHLAESGAAVTTEAEMRSALDELGAPEEVAAAAREEAGSRPVRDESGMVYDVAAVLVLLLGGFVVPVVGWIAGVVMLWAGPRWSWSQKVLGTLAWPLAALAAGGGLAVPVLVPGRPAVSGLALVAAGLVVLAGLPAVCVHLLRSASRQRC